LTLYFNDTNADQTWQAGENAWVDYRNSVSWFEARKAPWAQAMGLALYLKFDDAGEHIEDFAWHADWRAFWAHAIKPQGIVAGQSVLDFGIVYDGNEPPTVPGVEINPSTAAHMVARDAYLRVDVTKHSVDPETGRIPQYLYNWYVGAAAPVLPDGDNDTYHFVDADLNGMWEVDEQIWQDADNDGVFTAGVDRVVVDSAAPLATTRTLDLLTLNPPANQTYFVVVVARDEFGKDSTFAVAHVTTTANMAPTRPTFGSFTPEVPQEGDQLTVQLSNADDGIVSIKLEWYRNLELAGTDEETNVRPGESVSFNLAPDLVDIGDAWSFKAYADDGVGGVSRPTMGSLAGVRAVRIVGGGFVGDVNGPPTQPSVTISPLTAYPEDQLVATVSGSTDPDGDQFSYLYQWYQFDDTLGEFGEFTAVDGEISPILSEALTAVGDRWFCRVYAEDVFGNRSVPVSTQVVTIQTGLAGTMAYEPNDTRQTARRILPKANPTSLADPAVQDHAFDDSDDHDWFRFTVADNPGQQSMRVIFETNGGTEMFGAYHTMSMDFVDTMLTLYDGNGKFLDTIDDYGNPTGAGGTRYARFDKELAPGVYYVRVSLAGDYIPGFSNYTAHLIISPIGGAGAPAEPMPPTEVVLTPAAPDTSDDLVCTAAGAVSEFGEEGLTYLFVWYRNGRLVPFGTGELPYAGAPEELAYAKTSSDGAPANVLLGQYTREGETWSCVVYAEDANGVSTPVASNEVTIGVAGWTQELRVVKTFTDGTQAVDGDEQTVVIGWDFDATHGFDVGIDQDLPSAQPPPGDPSGPPNGVGGTVLPAGRSYSVGMQPEHPMLTRDIRPYGGMASWYIKIELGMNPATFRMSWDDVFLPVADTPLTMTQVTQTPDGDFLPVYGTTIDMLQSNTVSISGEDLQDLQHDANGQLYVIYRVSFGAGDTSQTITLRPAWNLVSFSVLPTNPAVDAVFSYNGQKVYAGAVWAYQNGGYVPVTMVEPKKAYWVYCPFSGTTTFTVHGMSVRGVIPLQIGWNMVGPVKAITNVMDAYGPYDVIQGNGSVYLNSVYGYNAAAGTYVLTNSMTPGSGYWVKAEKRVDLPADPAE
jgi:hypothetical protein